MRSTTGILPTGAFDDQWTFQLTSFTTYFTVASATNVFTQPSDLITGFKGSVFQVVGAIGGADDVLVLGPAFGAPVCGFGCQAFGGSGYLPSGEYYLDISGFAGSTAGYGGNLATIGVGAVPEPSTWAMLLLGFAGIVGMATRRRDKNASFRLV